MYRNNKNSQFSPEETLKPIEYITEVTEMLRTILVEMMNEKLEKRKKQNTCTQKKEEPLIMMVLSPLGLADVFTNDECRELFGEDEPDAETIVFDEQLFIRFCSDDVVELDGVRYLMGMAVIVEIDENGNDCSITYKSLADAFDFVESSLTYITVDGKSYPAFRLDE